jgi:uncharacterized protein (TIGR03437 family)
MRTLRRIAPLLALLAPACFGYIRQVTPDAAATPLRRTDNAGIQVLMNDKIVPGLLSTVSSKIVFTSGSDPQAAIQSALATWNAVGTANVRFLPLKSTAAGINTQDNQMVIAVASSPDELSVVGGALAVTVVSFAPVDLTNPLDGSPAAKGTIIDSDIIINPNPAFSFSTDGTTTVDLQSVMTHELGHSLSANHSGLLGASMFQFNSGQRFLTDDDVTFVNAAYPLPGGAALGTITGTITAAGAPVPFGLLTIFDTSSGVSISALTNPDGTYSIQVPAGNYQMYAEPLNGAVAINVYLTGDQAAVAAGTKFQTTQLRGSVSVAAGGAATANIAVTPGASGLATPSIAVVPVTGSVPSVSLGRGAPVTVPSAQVVELIFGGAGFDGSLNDSNFTVLGPGISLRPETVKTDGRFIINGNPALSLQLDVAPHATPSLASLIVTSGANTLSLSGVIVIVPPTPTFVSRGVVSAASGLGSPSGDGGVSPGGLYSIYDIPNTPNLGPAAFVQNGPYDVYGNLAAILGGVTVTFDGIPAPMFFSSGGQLNFQAPFELAGKVNSRVVVNYFGSRSAVITVPVVTSQPALFTLDGKAAIVVNRKDATLNTAGNPAARGDLVDVYGTGIGAVSYVIQTGKGAPLFPAGFTGNYIYTIGGAQGAPALFGGWVVGSVGLAQWVVQIPLSSATGTVPITVTDLSGATSQPGATIFVK